MTSRKSVLNNFVKNGKHLAAVVGFGAVGLDNVRGTDSSTSTSMKELSANSAQQKNYSSRKVRDCQQLEHEAVEAERRAAAIEKRNAARFLRKH